jgi:anti-anti-sigma factor
MEIAKVESQGVTILVPVGRIDAGTAEEFKQQVLAAIGDRPLKLVLDFAKVEFISSIGLRMLVVAAKRVTAVRGKLAFCGLEGSVREVFELAGFTAVAPFFPGRDAAVAALAWESRGRTTLRR